MSDDLARKTSTTLRASVVGRDEAATDNTQQGVALDGARCNFGAVPLDRGFPAASALPKSATEGNGLDGGPSRTGSRLPALRREGTIPAGDEAASGVLAAGEKQEAAECQISRLAAECARLDSERLEADNARQSAKCEIEKLTAERDALIVRAARIETKLAAADRRAEGLRTGLEAAAVECARLTAESLRWFGAGVAPIPRQASSLPVLTSWWRLRRVTRKLIRGRGEESLMFRADRARDAHQWEHAARYYRDAVDEEPRNPAIWVQLGHALKEAGKICEAESAYRLAIELESDNYDTYLNLGHALKLQEKIADAISAYRRASDLAPNPEIRGVAEAECIALGKAPT